MSWVLLLCLLLLALAAPVAAADSESVKVRDFEFSPAKVRISAGDKVKWRNVAGTHTVTMDKREMEMDAILSGESEFTSDKFKREGVYKYVCTFHILSDDMKGKVIVGDRDRDE